MVLEPMPPLTNQVKAIHGLASHASAQPSAESVGAAVCILQRDGIVIIKQVVDREALATMNKVLTDDSLASAARLDVHYNNNRDSQNISQPPPLTPGLSIWGNPFVAAVAAAMLGPNPHVHYANGNTALPNSHGRQTVHADLDRRHLAFPFGLVANCYLDDTDAWNGSTEIWVGTHRDTTVADHVQDS